MPESISLDGLNLSDETFNKMFTIDKNEWSDEAKAQIEYLSKFGDHLPKELRHENEELQKRLS